MNFLGFWATDTYVMHSGEYQIVIPISPLNQLWLPICDCDCRLEKNVIATLPPPEIYGVKLPPLAC